MTRIRIASSECKVLPITKCLQVYEEILMTPNLLKYKYYYIGNYNCIVLLSDYFDEHNILMEFVPRFHRKLTFAHAAFT